MGAGAGAAGPPYLSALFVLAVECGWSKADVDACTPGEINFMLEQIQRRYRK